MTNPSQESKSGGLGTPDSDLPGFSRLWIEEVKRGGSSSVWDRLHRRYHGPLILFARHRLGHVLGWASAADAEDLVQEAWARTLPLLEAFEYRGPGSFRKLLAKKIAEAAGDWGRKGGAAGRKIRSGPRVEPDSGLVSSGLTPSAIAAGREEQDQLYEALNKLPGPYRDVWVACGLGDETAVEYATKTGQTPDTVRKQLERARERLRRALGRPDPYSAPGEWG